MDTTPGSGRYTPVDPSQPNLLYDRDVRTRVFQEDPGHLRAVATLRDDTLGPHGFATVHHMSLEVVLASESLAITEVDAGMANHPHGVCPITLRQMQQLVGLRVGKGYFAELSKRFGGNRGCNHLLALAQSIGTIVALSAAASITYERPQMIDLDPPHWFRKVADLQPRIVNSCVIWHENGDLVRRIGEVEE